MSFSILLKLPLLIEGQGTGEIVHNEGIQTLESARSDRLVKDIPGSGDITLVDDELFDPTPGEIQFSILEFTGLLTGNRRVFVPNRKNWWFIKNATTGAFTLEVLASTAGSGSFVPQGETRGVSTDGALGTEIFVLAPASGLSTKSNSELKAAFSGNPKKRTVTFITPFTSSNYSIALGVESVSNSQFVPVLENIASGSFVINMTVNNINDLTAIRWIAVLQGET